MVYIERRSIRRLGKLAILAPVPGTFDHQASGGGFDHDQAAEEWCLSARRALDFQSDSQSAAAM